MPLPKPLSTPHTCSARVHFLSVYFFRYNFAFNKQASVLKHHFVEANGPSPFKRGDQRTSESPTTHQPRFAAQGRVDAINKLEPQMKTLSDEQLAAKTQEFKDRLAKGQTIDDLLVEAFAVVREATFRILGLRPYDVQLIGGMILHDGQVAEMRTGEGKTLVSIMPAYLNALEGKGVHVVTVNDYLARRDMELNSQVRPSDPFGEVA